MNTKTIVSLIFCFFAAVGMAAAAPDDARRVELNSLKSRLKYQSGEIQLRDGLAAIKLTDAFRYLDPAGAETLLTGIWGNPASQNKLLGVIVPAEFDPFDPNAWCVIIDFSEDGYVSDSDAAKINYADLLKEMKAGTSSANEERQKNGYPPMELIGWAATPRYDQDSHKFYWAKEIKFGDSTEENTLNYNIRVLGRRGVLVLNVVSGMSQLSEIEKATPEILSMVNFNAGNAYADYVPGTDKIASYGLAALVAGGIAAKTGLFKGLLVAILAFKKVIFAGLIAVTSLIMKVFKKKPASDGGSASIQET